MHILLSHSMLHNLNKQIFVDCEMMEMTNSCSEVKTRWFFKTAFAVYHFGAMCTRQERTPIFSASIQM